MSNEGIKYFLGRIADGYYEVIDGRLHREGKPRGSVQHNGYLAHGSANYSNIYAHRLLFAYYYGIEELEKYESINHKDGDKLNNSPENLEGMSLRENTKHQWKTNLAVRGENCSYAKLTEGDVREIKELLNEGLSQAKVATKFGVHRSTILSIHNGRNWKHIS